MSKDHNIVFDNVSKFYGEVLGVNRVHLDLEPGITGLVGPNGSGKTTLMNLMTGLLRPTEGSIRILGASPADPEGLFHNVGYSTQYDSFPRGFTGRQFIESYLRVHGHDAAKSEALTDQALERVGMVEPASRRIAAYSKGMRQRIKLAQAICHDPRILVLDEPLNGLDPMARAEMIAVFREFAREGRHLVISSHILHEVDLISDQVVLLDEGYVVAEGAIKGVRSEMKKHPLQILIRCKKPATLASRVFEQESVVEVKIHTDRGGLMVSTRDADGFFVKLNEIVLSEDLGIDTVTPADEDVQAVYAYLIGNDKEQG